NPGYSQLWYRLAIGHGRSCPWKTCWLGKSLCYFHNANCPVHFFRGRYGTVVVGGFVVGCQGRGVGSQTSRQTSCPIQAHQRYMFGRSSPCYPASVTARLLIEPR